MQFTADLYWLTVADGKDVQPGCDILRASISLNLLLVSVYF